jgi:hypothetical protein
VYTSCSRPGRDLFDRPSPSDPNLPSSLATHSLFAKPGTVPILIRPLRELASYTAARGYLARSACLWLPKRTRNHLVPDRLTPSLAPLSNCGVPTDPRPLLRLPWEGRTCHGKRVHLTAHDLRSRDAIAALIFPLDAFLRRWRAARLHALAAPMPIDTCRSPRIRVPTCLRWQNAQ